MSRFLLSLIFGCCTTLVVRAQVRIYSPQRTAERSVEGRVNGRINQGIDRGLDKVEEGVLGIFKKKNKPSGQNQSGSSSGDNAGNGQSGDQANGDDAGGNVAAGPAGPPAATLTAYRKFDFVPGEKVLVADDFMQDAVGDFPAKWNSTGSGELVTIEGKPGHWLLLNRSGQYLPEYITNLPDNFTLQFDLAANQKFSFYNSYLNVVLAALKDPAKEFSQWQEFRHGPDGVIVSLHPRDAGSSPQGLSNFISFAKGEQMMKNNVNQSGFNEMTSPITTVSFWRQKQRLRVYVGSDKIWDLPRAFQPDVTYNSVVFYLGDLKDKDGYYISNLRLAVGAPDTRNKLLTEGKFVTRGILFDPASDKIKPESYGALKDIANVLTENTDVRVRIIGHTDADGDDASNLALSKKRAAAVKAALTATFNIADNRMEADGKGETQPAGPNTTPEGKANNRRVEFVKL